MTNKNLTFSWIAFLVGLINACFVQAEPITDPKHLLSPDEAFHLTVEARPSEIITLNWQIAPGYQLYREQFRILNAKDRQPLLTYSALPKGMPRFDEVLGTYQVYEQMVVLNLTWRQSILDAGILVHYQGCADSGYCYPPLMKIIDIEKDGTYSVKDYDGTLYALEAPPNQQANTTSILELFDKSLPLTLISFLGLGILLTLTPCVLPMIPILASIIVGSKPTGLLRTLVLTTTYVLAMATTYAIAGVIAARLGYSVQAQFQSVYFIIPMVILLSVLALIQFGIIETNVFTKFNNKINVIGQKQQGSILGALIMGSISALIISPCVTPAFIGALAFISQQAKPMIGGLALFSLGLGMGAALFAVAILGGTVLPKAGLWMNVVRNSTGVLLVALIIWLLERILSPSVTLFLWGLFILLVGVYVGAFDMKREKTDWVNFWRGVGVLLAIFGTLLMVSSFSRSSHIASPFVDWLGSQAKPLTSQNNFHEVKNEKDLQNALKLAQKKDDYSIVYFTASWCTYCKKIDTLLSMSDIESKMLGLHKILIDVSNYTPEQRSIMRQWRVFAPPAFMFLTPDGKEIQDYRLVGDINEEQLKMHLDYFTDQFPEAKP